MESLFGTRTAVTTDIFHFIRATAEFFLKKNISMTGTLRARKSDILAMVANAKDRDHLSSKFIFSDGLAVVSNIV